MEIVDKSNETVAMRRGAVRILAILAAAVLGGVAFSSEARAQFTGPGIYTVSVAQTGDALDIDTSWWRGGNPGQPLNRWGRNNGMNQTFAVFADGTGFIMRPLHSLQCLDVRGGSSAVGAPLQQFPCHGGINQRFFISPGPTTLIRSAVGNRILSATTPGGGVVLAAPPAVLLVGQAFVFNRM